MRQSRKCIIFGGGGFIGSHLAEELLKRGHKVTVFDKLNFSKANIESFIDDISVREGDFHNTIDIRSSVKDADVVYHLVSSTLPAGSNENPVYDVETNLISSLKLFRECVESRVKRTVFLSSGGTVYGVPNELPVTEDHPTHPICSYGIVKKSVEDYLFLFNRLYGLEYFVFRLSNPFGERQNPNSSQGVIPVFISKVLRNEKITVWGDGSTVRDYIYIKDAVSVLAAAAGSDAESGVYNLSTGKGVSVNEILGMISEVSGKGELNVEYAGKRDFDVPVSVLENSRLMKSFDWRPVTDIKEGIRITYNYLRGIHEQEL